MESPGRLWGLTYPPSQWVPGAPSRGVKRTEQEVVHSIPPCGKFKMSGAIPLLPLYTYVFNKWTETSVPQFFFFRFADRAYRYSLFYYLTNLMHKICFTVSFISRLYMFRAHVLPIRRSKLHYTVSGIITSIGLFYNKFYFTPLHVSSTCALHQEVKIA